MPFEILSNEELQSITGKKRYSAQATWFRQTFATEPVCRPDGSILLTRAAFEALLLKRMGIGVGAPTITPEERPPIYSPFKDNRR